MTIRLAKRRTRGVFCLKGQPYERAKEFALYIIENNATVRQTAKAFDISKSTVHKDVTERLLLVSPALFEQCRRVLMENKAQRHIRGGQATKEKFDKKSGGEKEEE